MANTERSQAVSRTASRWFGEGSVHQVGVDEAGGSRLVGPFLELAGMLVGAAGQQHGVTGSQEGYESSGLAGTPDISFCTTGRCSFSTTSYSSSEISPRAGG
jgi:hypothetical protein